MKNWFPCNYFNWRDNVPLVKGTQNHRSLINIESTCWFIPTSFWHNKSLGGVREIWLYWPFVTRVTGKWTVNYWECKTQYTTSPDKKKQTQHDKSKPVASQEYQSIQINRLVLGSKYLCIESYTFCAMHSGHHAYLEFQFHILGEHLRSPGRLDCPGRSQHGSHTPAQSTVILQRQELEKSNIRCQSAKRYFKQLSMHKKM